MQRQVHKILLGLIVVAVSFGNGSIDAAFATNAKQSKNSKAKAAEKKSEKTPPVFDPSRVSIIPEVELRAWELNPYQVLVWLCVDGSPRLNAKFADLKQGVLRRAEITDPSGWNVHVQSPPPEWRNRMLRSIETAEEFEGIQDFPELKNADKLVVVALNDTQG